MRDISWKLENPHKITEEELAALEERFDFRMPEDMRQFYLQHNGGILPSGAKIDSERCKLTDFLAIKYPLMEQIPIMDTLLEWQKMDGFIPMYYIPFCNDEAGDSYYIRVDEVGYGKVYYIFSEFLDDFLDDSEGEGLIADSFTEFWEMMHFPKEDQ